MVTPAQAAPATLAPPGTASAAAAASAAATNTSLASMVTPAQAAPATLAPPGTASTAAVPISGTAIEAATSCSGLIKCVDCDNVSIDQHLRDANTPQEVWDLAYTTDMGHMITKHRWSTPMLKGITGTKADIRYIHVGDKVSKQYKIPDKGLKISDKSSTVVLFVDLYAAVVSQGGFNKVRFPWFATAWAHTSSLCWWTWLGFAGARL